MIKYWVIRLIFVDIPILACMVLAVGGVVWCACMGLAVANLCAAIGWAIVVAWLWCAYRDVRRSLSRRGSWLNKISTGSGLRSRLTLTGSGRSGEN